MTEAGSSLALIRVHNSIKDMIINAANYLQKECSSQLCQVGTFYNYELSSKHIFNKYLNTKQVNSHVFLQDKFLDLLDSVEISISVFFSMKDIPNMLQDPANPKVSWKFFSLITIFLPNYDFFLLYRYFIDHGCLSRCLSWYKSFM